MSLPPGAGLPLVRCAARKLGALTADRDAEPWASITPISLGDVVTGGAPEQGTEVRVAWVAEELRVLFHAIDAHPWATLTERDAPLYTEEVVELFVDPVGDLASYFEIEVNPLNAVLDLVIRRIRSGLVKDFAWRCDRLRTAVRSGSGLWAAELSVPFVSLIAEPPQPGAHWRVNFCRIDRPPGRERELTAWSPTGAPLFHVPPRFGTLIFDE